jgi:hypothetical protein
MAGITAYEIATHAGPHKNSRYYGCITRGEGGRYRIIFATPAMFETAEVADDAMRQVIIATTAWVENDLKTA